MWNEEKEESIVLLTNHLFFGPTTIAAAYKDRWQIEIFNGKSGAMVSRPRSLRSTP